MKETFPPRPTFTPTDRENRALFKHELETFREEERTWFEELLAHPHVKYVMHIPPDEPIFVLRAQDKFAIDAILRWQDSLPFRLWCGSLVCRVGKRLQEIAALAKSQS